MPKGMAVILVNTTIECYVIVHQHGGYVSCKPRIGNKELESVFDSSER